MNRSRIPDAEIVKMYLSGEKILAIQSVAGITRAGVYGCLKRNGITVVRREVLDLTCRFCGEKYKKPRSHVKGENGGYCSPQCFHADRSISGEYSKFGGALTRISAELGESKSREMSTAAKKAIMASGIKLKLGQVVHHIDGDRTNNDIKNLRVFNSQSEHMKFHHSLRGKNI